jgi:ribosome assembly protein YihI (activator of Der GTPase)
MVRCVATNQAKQKHQKKKGGGDWSGKRASTCTHKWNENEDGERTQKPHIFAFHAITLVLATADDNHWLSEISGNHAYDD